MNLSDIYSYIDSKKRAVGGLLSEPGLTIDKYVSQFREDNKDRLNLQANAYPMAGDRTVLNSPHQLDQFRKQLADEGANMAMAAATVWHGSPHKFDKFDSSKIGTGEGAQAYGHGLYLAEAPAVAKEYQAALGAGRGGDASDVIARLLDAAGGDAAKAAAIARQRAQYANIPGGKESLENMAKQIEQGFDPRGSLYKVDLPDEHIAKMLDWDKPLSQQAPEVQAAVGDYMRVAPDWTGAQLYNDMVSHLGGQRTVNQGGVGGKVSERLKAQGIPGIRYLDGGSRGAGAGSSNYVIFPGNEGLLNILERNGQTVNDLLK